MRSAGVWATSIREIAYVDGGDAGRDAPEAAGARQVVFEQRNLRLALEPADGEDVDAFTRSPRAQTATRSSGACSDHSFSRL